MCLSWVFVLASAECVTSFLNRLPSGPLLSPKDRASLLFSCSQAIAVAKKASRKQRLWGPGSGARSYFHLFWYSPGVTLSHHFPERETYLILIMFTAEQTYVGKGKCLKPAVLYSGAPCWVCVGSFHNQQFSADVVIPIVCSCC